MCRVVSGTFNPLSEITYINGLKPKGRPDLECNMTKGIEDRSDQTEHCFSHILLLGLAALLCASITASAEAPHSATYSDYLTPAKAQAIALRDNPSLAKMQARYEALAQIPSQTGALPDPVVSFNALNLPTDSFDLEQEAMTQMQVGISQKFPFPGKLSLREEAAEFEAKAAKYSVDEMRLRLSSNVSTKWWQIYYLDRALETVESNLNLLRQFVQVAQKKYEVGDGLQQDVLLAQLELSKLLDKQIQISALRRNQAIQLNLLMSIPGNREVVLPDKVPNTRPEIADEEILYARARVSSPLLMEKRQKHEAAQSRLSLAQRDYYPDFKLGVAYGNRRGDNPPPINGSRSDFLSVRVGIEIPLYAGRKQSKAVKQRSWELAQRRYAVLDTRNAIQGDISTAVTDYQRARERYSLFETGIVPQARQTVQSMMAGYKVSQVDFLNLVRSQITLFNNELQYWKALTQAQQALARLQAAVGEESIYE